uniref:Prolyl 4-hydroxylase alpha subunit domain-containing protein n=1 Tax=Timema douglasi TaxID=61478 RepID=A0A7R8VVB6_TIMDO|nr:unnamed protein product [Timema douglasi]
MAKGGYHSGLHGVPGRPTAEESTEDRSLIAFLKDQKSRFEERDGLERDAETQRMKEENNRRVQAILDEESKRDKSARPEGTFQRSRALEKLRNMEWKRNIQDHSEITRDQNERHAVMKTLPHKEQESVYFSGTRPEKLKGRKKGNRELSTTVTLEELERPPDSDTRPRFTQAPPPRFTQAPPPPDNAWSKKSGSELFSLPPVKSQEQAMLDEAIAASLLTYQVEKTRFPSSQIEYQEEVDDSDEYPTKHPFLGEVSKMKSKPRNNGETTKPLSAYDDKNSRYEGQDWVVYNDNKLHSQRDLLGHAQEERAKPNRNNTLSTNSDKKLIYKFPSHSSQTEENWDSNASDNEVDKRTEEKAGRKDMVARVEADKPNSTVSSHLDENINKHCEQNLSKDNNKENTKVNEYANNLRNDTNTSKTVCEKKAENVTSLDLSGHARKKMSVHVNETSDQICVEQFLRFIPSSDFPQDSSLTMTNNTRVCESDAHYSITNTSSGSSSVKDATALTQTPRAVSISSDVNDNPGYSLIPASHGCVDTPLVPISGSAGNKTPLTTTVADVAAPRTESNGLPPGIPDRPWSSIGDFNNMASNVPNWLHASGQTENTSFISGGDTTNPFFLKNNEHPNSVPNKDISATPRVMPHLLEQMMYINQNMSGMRLSAGGESKIYPYPQTLPLVQPGGGVDNAGNMAVGAEAQSNAYYPAFHPNMALPCDQLSANMPQESREANQTSAAFQLHQQAALMQANCAMPQINMQNSFGVYQIPPLLNTHFGGNALLPGELLLYQLQLQQHLLQEMMNQSTATREQMTAPQKQYLTKLMTSTAAEPNTVTAHTSGVNLHPQQNTALSHSSEVNLYPQPNTALSHSSEVNLYPQNTALSHSSEVNLYPQPNTALSHSSGVNLYPQPNTALAHSSGVNLYPQNTALSHSSEVNLYPQPNTALSHSSGVNLYPQNTALAHSSGVNLHPQQNTALSHSSGVNLYPQPNTALAHSSGVNLYPQQNTALALSSGVNLYPQQNTALAHSSGVNLYPQQNTALAHSSGVNLYPQPNTALSRSSGLLKEREDWGMMELRGEGGYFVPNRPNEGQEAVHDDDDDYNIMQTIIMTTTRDTCYDMAAGGWCRAPQDIEDTRADAEVLSSPFKVCIVKRLVSELERLRDVVGRLVEAVPMPPHETDLFKFRQSSALTSAGEDTPVSALVQFLECALRGLVEEVTGLTLDGVVTSTMSLYGHTDYLLCHDDRQNNRKIAFIWYLNKDWREEYGGHLDLFDSNGEWTLGGISGADTVPNVGSPLFRVAVSARGYPTEIVRSILPEENSLVFFEVCDHSFHQMFVVLADLYVARKYEVADERSLGPTVTRFLNLMKSQHMFALLEKMTQLELASKWAHKNGESSLVSPKCGYQFQRWRRGFYTLASDEDFCETVPVLDVFINFNCAQWTHESGGFMSYIGRGDEDELLNVPPQQNNLAIVYRNPDTSRFVKYINSFCEEQESFYTLSFSYYECGTQQL